MSLKQSEVTVMANDCRPSFPIQNKSKISRDKLSSFIEFEKNNGVMEKLKNHSWIFTSKKYKAIQDGTEKPSELGDNQ